MVESLVRIGEGFNQLFEQRVFSHFKDEKPRMLVENGACSCISTSMTRYACRLVVQSQFAFSSVFRRVLHYIALYCTASAHTLKLAFSSLPLPTCTRLR